MRALFVLAVAIACAAAYQNYPGSCDQSTSSPHAAPNNGAGSHTISAPTSYTAGNTYTITITGTYTGYILWAETASGCRIGSFTTIPSAASLQNSCGPAGSTVGHNTAGSKTGVSFTWTAPSTASGNLTWKALVVDNLNNSYKPTATSTGTGTAPSTCAPVSTKTEGGNSASSLIFSVVLMFCGLLLTMF